jgi:hypothetical protein
VVRRQPLEKVKDQVAIPARNGPGYFLRGDDTQERVNHTRLRGSARAATIHDTAEAFSTDKPYRSSINESTTGDDMATATPGKWLQTRNRGF